MIFKNLSKFNCSISVIPNGLQKYMSFTLGKSIVFIDSMLFMNSSLDKLVKNLNDFKYLSSEFGGEQLELVKKKGVYLYEYMNMKGFKKIDYLIKIVFLVLWKIVVLVKKNILELVMFGKFLK